MSVCNCLPFAHEGIVRYDNFHLRLAVMRGENYAYCTSVAVRYDQLVPDIALTHISKQ